MPTYQYACTSPDGKHQFEVVQSFTDAPVSECPECGSPVRKVYGSIGVVFKGSGFYRTDSRATSSSEAGSSSTKKDAAPATAGSSSSNGSSSNGSSSSGSPSSAGSSTSSGGTTAS